MTRNHAIALPLIGRTASDGVAPHDDAAPTAGSFPFDDDEAVVSSRSLGRNARGGLICTRDPRPHFWEPSARCPLDRLRPVGVAAEQELILSTARRLTLESGVVPSLNAVVAAAGVSKGGLMHHFPTRASLIAGLARAAIADVDVAMSAAAASGHAAETWLRLSLPGAEERQVMQGLAAGFRPTDPVMRSLLDEARSALVRWEALIAAEVGDLMRARVIRMVGDALVANAVAGIEPAPDYLDDLVTYLVLDGRPGEKAE